ncbi:hypothetical protein DBR06_SOUSAS1010129, partial [Sousa chinensis]
MSCVNLKVSFKRLGEKQNISRNLCEENQMNEELTGQKKSLQTEQVPLQPENPQLESEIQKLQLNLEADQEHVTQIQRKSIRKEMYRLKIEKKRPEVHRNTNYTHQEGHLCRKMTEDVDKELGRITSFDPNQILFYE